MVTATGRLSTFLIIFLFIFSSTTYAKVEPPNYNFSIDSLSVFNPGSSLEDIQKKFGKGELMHSSGLGKSYKFYVAQIRYKFPIFVQVYNNKVVDFYARLPSYFLHNIFHQSLINRYGKQDEYFKVERSAIYIWKNAKGIKFTYSGSCTITCFPMYLHGVYKDLPAGLGGFTSLLKKMSLQKNPKDPR